MKYLGQITDPKDLVTKEYVDAQSGGGGMVYAYGMYHSASSTNISRASGSWANMNAFTGYTYDTTITNSDFFQADVNGIRVLQDGYYKISASVHFNAAGSGNAYAIRFYDYTADTVLGGTRFGYANGIAWNDVDYVFLAQIPANHIILTQYERYSGSQNWRVQDAVMILETAVNVASANGVTF